MKFNWGHKILLIYLSFILMIGFLVYRSTQEHLDLVSEDYYDKEVKYQRQINDMQNTLALNEKPYTVYNKNNGNVKIKFPEAIKASLVEGDVNFFKPDNASLDFSVKINLNENNIQNINSKNLIHGSWKVKTSWTINNISYYQEENIFIN